jgi:hypothetical protein
VAVPAGEGTVFEVVQAEAGLQLPMVVFDPPADLAQPDHGLQRGADGYVRQPVLDRFGFPGRPLGDQPALGRAPVAVAGDVAVRRTDVVPSGDAVPALRDLRTFLSVSVPEYMLPNAVVPVGEMPTTPSGKLDRKRLPWPVKR